MIIFIFSLLIFIGSLYSFVKYRRDEESAKIYGIFTFVAYVASVISGINIIPEGYFGGGIMAGAFAAAVFISILAAAFIFLPKTGKNSFKGVVMLTALCMALVIIPLREGVLDAPAVYEIIETDNEAAQMICDRAYLAGEYAESIFLEETGMTRDDIIQKNYGFVTSEEPEFFAEFYYDDGDGTERKYYYKISVNDDNECVILESGEEKGMGSDHTFFY